ncbi:unnamed protein product [Sphagnum balticum]
MSTKKRRCDTRSPPPFEAPPPIAREEHEQNWHICCTFDLDTLECNICMDYLVAPICQLHSLVQLIYGFRVCVCGQCENGHTACSRCCFKLMSLRICPTCQLMTGVICNLQLEKLIETLHVACKYAEFGCRKQPRLTAKIAHEISCGYKSFKCPASVGCILVCSVSGISHHFQVKHAVKTVEVPSNEWVEILLELTVNSADLLLKTEDVLFLFHHEKQLYGRVIYILSFAEVLKRMLTDTTWRYTLMRQYSQ